MRSAPFPPIRPLDHLAGFGEDGAPALVLRHASFSYQELRSRLSHLAGWLASQVPEKGARVATWAAKGELTCLMPLAAARAGLVHVPVNPLLKHAQVRHILADSGSVMLIGTPARLATLQEGDVPEGCAVLAEEDAIEAAKTHTGTLGPMNLPRSFTPVALPASPRALCSAMPTCGWGRKALPATWI